jgi:hypothetical protein
MGYWLEIDVLIPIIGSDCLNIRQPPNALNKAMDLPRQGLFQILQKSH